MKRLLALGALLLLLGGCHKDRSGVIAARKAPVPDTIRIAAAVAPVSWLAGQIAGPPSETVTLIPAGADIHSFTPAVSQFASLERTRLYFSVGLPFEAGWSAHPRADLPQLEAVALPQNGRDLYVWSSPHAMLPWIDAITVALATAYPADSARIWRNRDRVRDRMMELDTAVAEILAPYSGRRFYINHPELGPLARDYGLEQKAPTDGSRPPSAITAWKADQVAGNQGIRAVFVQSPYSTEAAESLARRFDAPVVPLELYASPYDSGILRLARTLAAHL